MNLLWTLSSVCPSSIAMPRSVPLALQETYRQGYRKPQVVKWMKERKVHFATETRQEGVFEFFLVELAGVSTKPQEKIWPILRQVQDYSRFVRFFEETRQLSPVDSSGTERVYVNTYFWGFRAQMWLRLWSCGQTVHFVVEQGQFTGLEGRLFVEPLAETKTGENLLVMEAHWVTKKVGIPWLILKFGMEYALSRMGQDFLKEISKK